MSLHTAIRILLSVTIVLIGTIGGAHGSAHVERPVVAAAQVGGAPRVVDNGCTSAAQTHCQVLGVTQDRPVWARVGEVRSLFPFPADDLERSGSDLPMEDEPPRSP